MVTLQKYFLMCLYCWLLGLFWIFLFFLFVNRENGAKKIVDTGSICDRCGRRSGYVSRRWKKFVMLRWKRCGKRESACGRFRSWLDRSCLRRSWHHDASRYRINVGLNVFFWPWSFRSCFSNLKSFLLLAILVIYRSTVIILLTSVLVL